MPELPAMVGYIVALIAFVVFLACFAASLAKHHESTRPQCFICKATADVELNGVAYCRKHYDQRMAQTAQLERVERWYGKDTE